MRPGQTGIVQDIVFLTAKITLAYLSYQQCKWHDRCKAKGQRVGPFGSDPKQMRKSGNFDLKKISQMSKIRRFANRGACYAWPFWDSGKRMIVAMYSVKDCDGLRPCSVIFCIITSVKIFFNGWLVSVIFNSFITSTIISMYGVEYRFSMALNAVSAYVG